MNYTTIKVTREIRDKIEEYARPRGISLGSAVARLLEENNIVEELREIRRLLEEQNKLLRDALSGLRVNTNVSIEASGETIDLPSFLSKNPWMEVLARRGRE